MKSLFGFGSNTSIDVDFGDPATLTRVSMKDLHDPGARVELPLYMNLDNIVGVVHVKIRPGKKLEHQGIKVELIGQVELTQERGMPKYVFLSLLKELEQPGEMMNSKSYKFEFSHVEKQYESYRGRYARLRYFVRVKISRQYATSIAKEFDFAVQNILGVPEINNSIKMEVGIEDCLHIEFEYDKDKYHLNDVVIGKIYFLLVRIKIKQMELQILRRETIGVGTNVHNDTEVLGKFEIMDGAPVRGECVPVRLFMKAYDLSPTMKDVYNKFSVRYFLNLVLIDEEDRRYFKQHEIQIWRLDRETCAGVAAS